jgi:hypothetical protein
MSGNLKEMVRFDLERCVTSRYDLSDIDAAMAALPWTTACSPKTITFPGAEVMKGGIIGVEALRSMVGLRASSPFILPFGFLATTSSSLEEVELSPLLIGTEFDFRCAMAVPLFDGAAAGFTETFVSLSFVLYRLRTVISQMNHYMYGYGQNVGVSWCFSGRKEGLYHKVVISGWHGLISYPLETGLATTGTDDFLDSAPEYR